MSKYCSSSCQSLLYIEQKTAESSQLQTGEIPHPFIPYCDPAESPWDIFQDLRKVCDHGEVKICLVKKRWSHVRIMFLLGLFFMIMLFMWKYLFKKASLPTSTFNDPVVEFLSFLPSWSHHKFWKENKISMSRIRLTPFILALMKSWIRRFLRQKLRTTANENKIVCSL